MQAATLQILEAGRFNAAQSRVIAEAIDTEIESRKDVLATKQDIHDLELKIEESKVSIIQWIVAYGTALTGIILGGVYFMLNHIK